MKKIEIPDNHGPYSPGVVRAIVRGLENEIALLRNEIVTLKLQLKHTT